jgi:hypothetical protein
MRNEPIVRPFKEGSAAANDLRVGARYEDGDGTSADISVSRNGRDDDHYTWINICTDDYEGHAMLHIEALPLLIAALQEVEAEIHKSA